MKEFAEKLLREVIERAPAQWANMVRIALDAELDRSPETMAAIRMRGYRKTKAALRETRRDPQRAPTQPLAALLAAIRQCGPFQYANLMHDGVEAVCRALGWETRREVHVEGLPDDRTGRLDLVVEGYGLTVAMELDNAAPRNKSVLKLNLYPCDYRYVVLRNYEGSYTLYGVPVFGVTRYERDTHACATGDEQSAHDVAHDDANGLRTSDARDANGSATCGVSRVRARASRDPDPENTSQIGSSKTSTNGASHHGPDDGSLKDPEPRESETWATDPALARAAKRGVKPTTPEDDARILRRLGGRS